MRKVTRPIPSTYERLEDVVRQQLNLRFAVGRPRKVNAAADRRQHVRCPHQLGAADAVLIRNGMRQRRDRVQLIDQSSSGYGVVYRGKGTFRKGQILLMQTQAGRHEVRVAYAIKRNGELRLGLERLCDNPEVSGVLSTCTLFLIVTFSSLSILTFALMSQ